MVRLEAEQMRRSMGTKRRRWYVALYQIEGILHPAPDVLDADDDDYAAMLESGVLEHVAIDELVELGIDLQRHQSDQETLPNLHKLQERLHRCLTMVDKEIARREERLASSSGEPPHS